MQIIAGRLFVLYDYLDFCMLARNLCLSVNKIWRVLEPTYLKGLPAGLLPGFLEKDLCLFELFKLLKVFWLPRGIKSGFLNPLFLPYPKWRVRDTGLSNSANLVRGRFFLISVSIFLISLPCDGVAKEMALPAFPARPVRPMRWT